MPGTSSHSTPAPRGTSQVYSMRRVASSLVLGINCTPTPVRGLDILPTPIPNPEHLATIKNPLQTQPTERNHRQNQSELEMQAKSTPSSMVTGSRCIYRFGHSNKIRLILSKGRFMELWMWNRQPFMSAYDLEMVS
jgi:hypothetical protein